MKRNEIRSKIYQLVKVTASKQFRKLFPEFNSYSLQVKADLKAILDCLEAEPEAVATAIFSSTITVEKVISLSNYKFNKKLGACQGTEDYIELIFDLNQEIVDECRKYSQHFRSKKL